ncbi:MAG: Gfo/Idh/MocA family oxidoreductase [Thermoguttaceae bacterium]|nr:Gfo/Idh/MocA family oxidoreductase [Thermoguttaceae bacterium]MDW8080084.1 Gfo/Idh/MocA family oxidoreductase [Thermoguttaceae bacterium]
MNSSTLGGKVIQAGRRGVSAASPRQAGAISRRKVLRQMARRAALLPFVPYFATVGVEERLWPRSAKDRFGIGPIGMRHQGTVITHEAAKDGDVVAIADVDRHVREQARVSFGNTPAIYEDYRRLLERKDVDVVMIGTPITGMREWWSTPLLPVRMSM